VATQVDTQVAAAIAATFDAQSNSCLSLVLARSTAGSLAEKGQASRGALSLRIRDASMEGSVELQTCDFVLHQQLATFQFHDLKIIDRWVGPCFVDFRLKGPVTSFQFRKMGFDGHVVEFSSVSWPDEAILHRNDGISKREFNDAEQQSPLCLTAAAGDLNERWQNEILFTFAGRRATTIDSYD
jgi:hypothetical protein